MDNTIAYFGLKDEDDYMYKRGAAKATSQTEARLQKEFAAQRAEAQREREQAQKQFELNQRFTVINLLDVAVLTELQIMNALDVSEALIQAIKKDLAAAPKKIARLKANLSAEQIAKQLSLPINWVEKQM